MKKRSLKSLVLVFTLFLSLTLLAGCSISIGSNSKDKTVDETTNSTTEKEETKNTSKNKYALEKPFEFDDLEITLGKEVSYTQVDNEYSDYYGKTVVKMPITIKNKKDETHGLNMFYYKVFGSEGTELKNVSSYFDDAVDYAGDLRPDASYTKYLYFLYDGDGVYAIEFDDWTNKITIEFKINK